VQIAQGVVSAYTGSSKTVTLAFDPAIFTMAASDNIAFFPGVNVRYVSEDKTAADTLELFAEALKQDTGQLDDGSFAADGKTGFSLSATGLDAIVKMKALLDGTPSGEIATDADPRTTTAFETTLTEATDDHYNGAFIVFYSGALAGQSRKIDDYDGTTKVVTVATEFTEAPAVGDDFLIIGRSE
jgi:hypothetical protein